MDVAIIHQCSSQGNQVVTTSNKHKTNTFFTSTNYRPCPRIRTPAPTTHYMDCHNQVCIRYADDKSRQVCQQGATAIAHNTPTPTQTTLDVLTQDSDTCYIYATSGTPSTAALKQTCASQGLDNCASSTMAVWWTP
jgi:hypothetical protein